MTLLTMAAGLAKNVGLTVPDLVVSSPLREWVEAAQMINEAGDELARRADWGALRKSATLTGDGTDKIHALPADFLRLSPGVAIRVGAAIVRPLTRAEWNALTPVVGVPRYFLLEGNTVRLFPYLAADTTATASYQSANWNSAGKSFMADDNTSLLDEDLLLKGWIVRWRRQKSMDYSDYEAEYEGTLSTLAAFNDRSRL